MGAVAAAGALALAFATGALAAGAGQGLADAAGVAARFFLNIEPNCFAAFSTFLSWA
jgi:hypothetical protein